MVNHRIESLDEIRTFATIVEAGSLAAAATRLGVTPNAVSRRLAVLEARLKRRLIHRTTRRLTVTEEGQAFHARCRRALDELAEAEQELLGADGFAVKLRIGLHSDMLGPVLIEGLRDLLEGASQLRIELRVSSSFIEPVRSGLDLAVYVGKPQPSSLVSVPLGSMVWSLAAAPRYVEVHGKPRTPKDLARHECLRIVREGPEAHWDLSHRGGQGQRFPVGGRFESTDGQALAQALYAGVGIGVRPRSEIAAAVRSGTLETVLPTWEWASTPLYALMPQGRNKLPGVRALLDVLRRGVQGVA